MLSATDLAAVLGAAEELARVECSGDFPPVALACARSLVACDSAGYNEVDPASGSTSLVLDPPGKVPPEAFATMARFADQHPVIAAHRRGDDRVLKISDFMTRAAFRRTDLYRAIYGPMGIEFQLSFTLPAAPPLVAGLALNRADRDFDERDREVLSMLRPHLEAALLRRRGVPRRLALTERQQSVAQLVAQGKTNAQIAADLSVSPGTVKKHLDQIYARIGVHSRAALAAAVVEALQGSI